MLDLNPVTQRCNLLTVILLSLMTAAAGAATLPDDPFPTFNSLQDNVAFWTDIYTHYPTTAGVIHDSTDLSIIYAVIDLEKADQPQARTINRERIKSARSHYEGILRRLARSRECTDPETCRVADLFGPQAAAERFLQAAGDIRCQVGQRDRFRQGLIRSGAYLSKIKSIFRSYGLPQDLAYLPHVESSFNPKANSKFGAAGIWQFTRSTGKRFMQVGYTLDERRDPFISTHAAAQLLKENYTKLGSWPLAITAYNHGAAGMLRAKDQKGDYEAIFQSYRSRTFGFASRNFYSEFLAARQVAMNYEPYFGELQRHRPQPRHYVELAGYMAAADVAEHFGIDLAVLQDYNLALRQPVFQDLKYIPRGYRLQLPYGIAEPAQDGSILLPERLYRHRQKPSRFYRVQRGDTAWAIAQMHGVHLSDLIMANHLDRRATIYVNQNLRLPLPSQRSTLVASASAPEPASSKITDTYPEPILASVLPVSLKQPEPEPLKPPEESPQGQPATQLEPDLVPSQGPSLVASAPAKPAPSKITETHPDPILPSVLPVSLKQPEPEPFKSPEESPQGQPAIQSEPDLIPSQSPSLVASAAAKPAPSKIAETHPDPILPSVLPVSLKQFELEPFKTPEESPQGQPAIQSEPDLNLSVVTGHLQVEQVRHVHGRRVGIIHVEVEETLGHYAEWLDVRASDLRRLNRLPFGRAIETHQVVLIPLDRISAQTFEERRFEYHQRIQEDFFASYKVEGMISYRAKWGDNIWTLCRDEFGVPLWLMRKCNPEVEFSRLQANQVINVPLIERIEG